MLSLSLKHVLHTLKVFVLVDVITVVVTAYSKVFVLVDVIAVIVTCIAYSKIFVLVDVIAVVISAHSKVFPLVDVIAVVVIEYSKGLCFCWCYRCRYFCTL